MAYADRDVGGSRVVAIVVVAVILAVTGYAFVTGLAYQYIKKTTEKMDVFDIEEPPPPPEEVPPPPPPDTPVPPPPTTVVVQKPIVQVPSPPIQIDMSTRIPPSQPPTPPAPPAPPAPPPPPPPPRIAKPLQARGQANWVTDADYPPAALRSGDQGTLGFRLAVGPDGRVTDCTVTSSSGSSLLDSTACRLLQRRARFSAAEDANGNKISATFASRFTWRIPEN